MTGHQCTCEESLQVLWDLARDIQHGGDPLTIFDAVLDRLHALSEIDTIWTWFSREADGVFELKAQRGLSPELQQLLDTIPTDTILGGHLRVDGPLPENWQQIWADLAAPLTAAGWQDVAVWPLVIDGRTAGALGAARSSGEQIPAHVRAVCSVVAAEVSNRMADHRESASSNNQRYNLGELFDAFEDHVFVVEPDGHIVYHNGGGEGRLGYGPDELMGQPVEQIIPIAAAMIRQGGITSEGQVVCREGAVLAANGRQVAVDVRVVAGHWDDCGVYYVVCRDVTSQRQMAGERDRLVMAIEQAAESFIITDAEGTIQYINPAFTELTGYTQEEVIGGKPSLLKSGVHEPDFYRQMWETISRGDIWTGRMVNRRKDGSNLTEEATISPVRDETGAITHFVGVKRDVTHEVDLEERLRQSQKMEAIGTLAGGIAHDFNNILYALLGHCELALDDIAEDHPASASLKEIATAGERAADLVAKMLTFGRRAESGREVLPLQGVVSEALDLARASLPSTITFQVDLDGDCAPVLADATQIHQVLLNLCANAEHTMRARGGVLTVSLRELHVDQAGSTAVPGAPPGDWACLQVGDTGLGMAAGVLERIFEPYFTTKQTNEGTGLGLATVHGIVSNHGGSIEVQSDLGCGTTFTILLPLAGAEVATGEAEPQEEPQKSVGSCNVMVIDDEPMIVDVVTRSLERQGYAVNGFNDGVKALEVLRADPGAFDIVITDQTMPGITGFELAGQLRNIRRDLPVILTTGHSYVAENDELAEAGIVCVLTKPLKIGALAEAVEAATCVPTNS